MTISTPSPGHAEQLLAAMQAMAATGLNHGTAGNVSLRSDGGMLVTPTGVPPEQLAASHMVSLSLDGKPLAAGLAPSSEWRMHAAIYRAHPGCMAVVHCHSPYATTLACSRRSIPPLHYMIAALGCREIPLADYATFGTEALSQAACQALRSAHACLLANHGQIAIGADLAEALRRAQLVEELARVYWGSLAIGGPVLLDDSQLAEAEQAFLHYGAQPARD